MLRVTSSGHLARDKIFYLNLFLTTMEKVSSYTIEKITNKLLGKRVKFISDCELFPNFDVNVQVISISISPNKEVLFDCSTLENRKKLIIGSKMKNLRFKLLS